SRELHLDRAALLVARLVKLAVAETEQPRDHDIGNALDRVVVVADRAVIEPPRVLQMLLDLDELALELEEVLARVEVGIRLLQSEDPRQPLLERGLDLGKPCRARLAPRLRARLRDRRQHGTLVAARSLHRLS